MLLRTARRMYIDNARSTAGSNCRMSLRTAMADSWCIVGIKRKFRYGSFDVLATKQFAMATAVAAKKGADMMSRLFLSHVVADCDSKSARSDVSV